MQQPGSRVTAAAVRLVFVVTTMCMTTVPVCAWTQSAADAQQPGAAVRGRVIVAETGAPVLGARVQMSSVEHTRNVWTAADGSFEVTGLPAGDYSVTAYKSEFLRQAWQQETPDGPGRRLHVERDALIEGLEVPLSRGAAIEGRVVDANGAPMANVLVEALAAADDAGVLFSLAMSDAWKGVDPLTPLDTSAGRRVLTDDLGRFRLFALEPGSWVVRARFRKPSAVLEEGLSPSPLPDAVWMPGTARLGKAAVIRLTAGEESAGSMLTYAQEARGDLSGVVVDSANHHLPTALVVVREPGHPPDATGSSAEDGRFVIPALELGTYTVEVAGDVVTNGRRVRERGDQTVVVGMNPIQTTIKTQPGVRVSGLVAPDDGSMPAGLNLLRVIAIFPGPLEQVLTSLDESPVADDGSFELSGAGGPLLLGVHNLPRGWALDRVLVDERDVTDQAVEARELSSSRVRLVLTQRGPRVIVSLSGTETSRTGDCAIVVFPRDRQHWHFLSSRVYHGSCEGKEQVTIGPVSPGRYYVALVEDDHLPVPPGPRLFEMLTPRAVDVTVGEKDVHLRLSLRGPTQP